MSKLLYLKDYNNYFNRIVKRDTTFTSYTQVLFVDRNFNPNDDVYTERVENWTASWTPDYMVLYDDNDALVSRWFVNESKRARNGQYRLTLKRDLVADFYDKIINAPMLVEKGMVTDPNNALLFNKEGFSFNQIKQQELLLKDRTRTPWYILYFNKNVSSKSGYYSTTPRSYDVAINVAIDDSSSPFKSGNYKYIDSSTYTINYNGYPVWLVPPTGAYYASFDILKGTLSNLSDGSNYHQYRWFYDNPSKVTYANSDWVADKFRTVFSSSDKVALDNNLQSILSGDFIDYNKFIQLKSADNSIVVKSTVNGVSKYYQVNVSISYSNDSSYQTSGALYNYIVNKINTISGLYHNEIDGKTIKVDYTTANIMVNTTEIVSGGELVWELDFANHVGCKDAPYRILAIPKYNIQFTVLQNPGEQYPDGWAFTCPQQNNDALVESIIDAYGTGGSELVDVQLLPYFPYEPRVQDIGDEDYDFTATIELGIDTTLDRGSQNHWRRYSGQTVVTDQLGWDSTQFSLFGVHDSDKCAAVFYIDQSTFTLDINVNLPIKPRTDKMYMNKKLSNELDLYRLCSPNYNGVFEYSNAKNNGTDIINVDCTLRPFNPYLHLNPNFKGLYGTDYNDSRGLICQGDFSIPLINDAWKTYELNNKNYQNSFNRQIEHMEFEQSLEKLYANIETYVGTGTGMATGAATGMMMGGNPAVGGAVGGAMSLIGGIADLALMDLRHKENLSYARDAFKYQLGNIKALPTTVNKITCLTANNKIWPFIEVYEASANEESLLNSYLAYSSMTINAIGTIESYLQTDRTFVSGKLIRLENLGLASHEAFEIYKELEKGVYI